MWWRGLPRASARKGRHHIIPISHILIKEEDRNGCGGGACPRASARKGRHHVIPISHILACFLKLH
jgi:hypothetical protein